MSAPSRRTSGKDVVREVFNEKLLKELASSLSFEYCCIENVDAVEVMLSLRKAALTSSPTGALWQSRASPIETEMPTITSVMLVPSKLHRRILPTQASDQYKCSLFPQLLTASAMGAMMPRSAKEAIGLMLAVEEAQSRIRDIEKIVWLATKNI